VDLPVNGPHLRRRPDFFIVGAWKSVTTSLYGYLKSHPDVFFPDVKEPHFFGTDMMGELFYSDPNQYLALYEPAGDAKRAGDASTSYLYSRTAAQEIFDFCGRVSIIVMLRNPVDMMYAHHSQRMFHGAEDIPDFRAALAAEEERKRRRAIPDHAKPVEWLFYRDIARYTEQVKRYFDVFGRDAVKIILFEDLEADTEAVYRDTVRFLDLDDSFTPPFDPRNPNRMIRSRWLQRVLMDPPQPLRRWGRRLLPDRQARIDLIEHLTRANTRVKPRPPMDHQLRSDLLEELTPEIEALADLLQRDLSHWLLKEGQGRKGE
jgi:hypothetical protein